MMKKLMPLALTAVVAIGGIATTFDQAEARRGRGVGLGVAAGIIGLGIIGAAAANAGPRYYGGGGCYPGPRQCYRAGGSCYYNRYGDYVCNPGRMVCSRPMICP